MSVGIDEILLDVRNSFAQARAKHKPMNSAHEGYSVILEELDELWNEVKRDDLERAKKEAYHVAAMAIRFIYDL